MTDYDQLDHEIYELVWKKYHKKYEVAMTGTTNPLFYCEQKANGAGSGLDIIIKVKGE